MGSRTKVIDWCRHLEEYSTRRLEPSQDNYFASISAFSTSTSAQCMFRPFPYLSWIRDPMGALSLGRNCGWHNCDLLVEYSVIVRLSTYPRLRDSIIREVLSFYINVCLACEDVKTVPMEADFIGMQNVTNMAGQTGHSACVQQHTTRRRSCRSSDE